MSRTSNVTAAFIDLATFELLESSLYGGSDAITYFVREVQKCTWFSQIPIKLTANGTAAFGQECTWTVSRAADYLLGTWLRVELPAYTASSGKTIAYGANPGHNLIQKAELLFNDLEVQSFNSYDLDWYAALMVPGGKQAGYYNMIGERSTLTDLTSIGGKIAAQTINVPLPFFYTRDSGVALPTAALPYNDIKIRLTFQTEAKMLVTGTDSTTILNTTVSNTETTIAQTMTSELWCNYAVVSNDERSKMGAGPRDIAIEQFQKADSSFSSSSTPMTTSKTFQVSFNHSVKMLAFSVKNTSNPAIHSNYTLAGKDTALPDANGDVAKKLDPLLTATLKYDNTERFTMDASYFQKVQPHYHAAACPHGITSGVLGPITGYNMYSFALNPMSQDPNGSTNFGKLTNVSLACNFNQTTAIGTGNNKHEMLIHALSMNIVRVSGGALGFPVL